jgi:hypothetical protein
MLSDTVKLSPREQRIFNLLKSAKIATLTRITEFLRQAEERQDIAEGSVLGTVKYLSGKVPQLGYRITRTSNVGRGNKAVYRMQKI